MNRVIQQMKSTALPLIFALSTLFVALCVVQSASAQQVSPAQPHPAPSAAATGVTPTPEEASAKKDSGLQQGIKMHGHWVINVRNPDGKLVEHREFENSLQQYGQGLLLGFLSGYMAPGDFAINLQAQSGAGPCSGAGCEIVRSTATYPGLSACTAFYCGTGLTVVPNFGTLFAGPYSLVLSGSIAVNNTGTIGMVSTVMNGCGNNTGSPGSIATISPATCVTSLSNATNQSPLSGTTLATPIAVTSGQIVQVIVTISFS